MVYFQSRLEKLFFYYSSLHSPLTFVFQGLPPTNKITMAEQERNPIVPATPHNPLSNPIIIQQETSLLSVLFSMKQTICYGRS